MAHDAQTPVVRSRSARLIAGLFVLTLYLPALSGLLGYEIMPGMFENRELAAFPWREAREVNFRAFAGKFDAFVNDHFGFRSGLIYLIAHLKYALNTSADPGVVIGRDDWLFRNEWNSAGVQYTAAVGADTVQLWHDTILRRTAWVKGLGGRFLMAIPPGKANLYPEYLPPWLQRQSGLPRFLDAMKGTNVDILNLAVPLEQAKGRGQLLFYKNDTHWNELGAFDASLAIINHLHATMAAVPAADAADYSLRPFRTDRKPDGALLDLHSIMLMARTFETDFDVARKGGWTTIETVRHDGPVDIYTYTKDAPDLPTILVYCDSFGFDLHRVVAEYFRRAVFVDWWPLKNFGSETFPLAMIEREHPDVFLYVRFQPGILGTIEPFPSSKDATR